MSYPNALIDMGNGLCLFLPIPEQVKPIYTQLKASKPSTVFPYWAQIWPSAIALSEFLLQEPHWIEGKQVLELGAGIGLPSFSISDYNQDAIALLQKNIRHLNLKNVEARYLDWNNFPTSLNADILLLSDVNYAPDQFAALLLMMQSFMKKGTTILLATPQRITVSPFITALEPFIKRTVFQSVLHGQQTVGIYLLLLAA